MRVKGSVLKARLQWVDQEDRQNGRARLYEAVSEPTRKLLAHGVVVSNWYDFDAYLEVTTAIDRVFGRGDLALCYALGRHSCRINVPSLYRVFLRLGGVHAFLARATTAWRVHYDVGSFAVIEETPKFARLHLDWPKPHRAHCLTIKGFVAEAAALCGETVIDEREICVTQGDPACEFAFTWK